MSLTAMGVGAISSLIGAGAQAYGAGLARKDARNRKNTLMDQLPGLRKAYDKENYFVDKSAYDLANQTKMLSEETKRQGIEQAQRSESQIASALRSGDPRMVGAMSPVLANIQRDSAQVALGANQQRLAGQDALSKEITRINELNKQKKIDLLGKDFFGAQQKIDAYQYAQDASRQAMFDALGGAATNIGSMALTTMGSEDYDPKSSLKFFNKRQQ